MPAADIRVVMADFAERKTKKVSDKNKIQKSTHTAGGNPSGLSFSKAEKREKKERKSYPHRPHFPICVKPP